MRRIAFRIEGEDLVRFMAGEAVEARGVDSVGARWSLSLRSAPAEPGEAPRVVDVAVEEAPTWAVLIGGHVIGHETHEEPGEAVREAFSAAGLSSLPEAVEVVARRDDTGESWVVFTLDGEAYCVPFAEFAADVLKSDRWTGAQRTKRTEIDALMAEIRSLAGKAR